MNLEAQYRWTHWSKVEAKVKTDATQTKKIATSLKFVAERYTDSLSDEQKLALRAAASVLRQMAVELEAARAWAKKTARTGAAKEEACAVAKDQEFFKTRFSGQEGRLRDEALALQNFHGAEGKQWLEDRFQVSMVYHSCRFSCESDAPIHEMLRVLREWHENSHGKKGKTEPIHYSPGTCRDAGIDDFELFMQGRQNAQRTAAAALSIAGRASPQVPHTTREDK